MLNMEKRPGSVAMDDTTVYLHNNDKETGMLPGGQQNVETLLIKK